MPGDVPAPLCCAANECRLWLCFSLILFFSLLHFSSGSFSLAGVQAMFLCHLKETCCWKGMCKPPAQAVGSEVRCCWAPLCKVLQGWASPLSHQPHPSVEMGWALL